MAVTIPDAQDLVAQLHAGTLGSSLWSDFLAALRRRTGADYAGIYLRSGQERAEVIELEAGRNPVTHFDETELDGFVGRSRSPLRPRRVYSARELPDAGDMRQRDFLRAFMDRRRLRHMRLMRVEEPGGGSLWIQIGTSGKDFGGSDVALLGSLADHLQIALSTWVALEKERLRAGITSDAMRRLNFGWFVLDPAGRIVDLSDEAEALLQKRDVLYRSPTGTLVPGLRAAQADLRTYLRDAFGGNAASRAIHLSDEPWLDMLLTTAKGAMRKRAGGPIVVAFVHGERPGSGERSAQLMDLFGLTEREAQLALQISRGVKIAEAADLLGITVETARLYSKRIYAKTGTRGQADLVRLILASILALS